MTGMGVGSRVLTPDGPGTVLTVYPDEEWEFGKLVTVVWLRVQIDNDGRVTFSAADCSPADADE